MGRRHRQFPALRPRAARGPFREKDPVPDHDLPDDYPGDGRHDSRRLHHRSLPLFPGTNPAPLLQSQKSPFPGPVSPGHHFPGPGAAQDRLCRPAPAALHDPGEAVLFEADRPPVQGRHRRPRGPAQPHLA